MYFTVAMVTLVAWFPINSLVISATYIEIDSPIITTHSVLAELMYTNTFSSSIIYFTFDRNYRVRS